MNTKTKILISITMVLTLALAAEVANSEIIFGTPTNLGPDINSSNNEGSPSVSADGLELYFSSNRPDGFGGNDIWVARRPTKYGKWGKPVNLGSAVNSSSDEITQEISYDGLEIYFESDRPGGLGSDDLWVAKRATKRDEWATAVWLGPTLNTSGMEHCPNISSDGLTLFFDLTPAGKKIGDLMVTRRATINSDWGEPANLGHLASAHWASSISADGSTLYFASKRPGGSGGNDIWQVPISRNGSPVSK